MLISNYKEPQSTLESWAIPGNDAGRWDVASTSGVKVGDSVAIQCYNTSKSGYVYIYGTVKSIDSSTILYMISAGMTDKGDTGATGPQGLQGATGPQGPKGEDGKNGTNLWVNPSFDADKPQITWIVNGVTAPNGSNVNLLNSFCTYG